MALDRNTGGAAWGLTAAAALALIAAAVYYFMPNIGIDGSLGVVLVIGSTVLMVLASAAVASGIARGGIRTLLLTLIFLDIVGTGFASYMLEANVLLALTIVALIAWLATIFARGRSRQLTSAEAAS